MYQEDMEDHIYIFHHDHRKKSLPFDGWYHNCVFCSNICSTKVDYFYRDTKFKIQLCNDCKLSNLLDKIKYQDKINGWINANVIFYKRKRCICF